MKIAFLDDADLDYTPQTPYDAPLGGTQSAAAYLSAALAERGHAVTLINNTASPGACRGVDTRDRGAARPEILNGFDALVVLTRPAGRALRRMGVTVPLISWQHKAAAAGGVAGLADPVERSAWNAVVYVSQQQRQTFRDRFGLDGEVLRNAVSPATLEIPLRPQSFLDRGEDPALIYASAPGRGLDTLLIAFAAIREALPAATLRICAHKGTEAPSEARDEYRAYYALARTLPGVTVTGAVSQSALAQAFSQADIMAYPTTFMETSCIVAMEAAAAGCLFAATDHGPLRETLAGYGVFTPLVNSRPALCSNFADLVVEAVRSARAGPEAFNRRRLEQAAMFRQTHSWSARAAEWEDLLEGVRARA